MTARDYILQRFGSFGIRLSEADILDIGLKSNVCPDCDVCSDNINAVEIGLAKFIPSLLMRASSINESGFSMSWDKQGIKDYYSFLCKRYNMTDELNDNKPRVRFWS